VNFTTDAGYRDSIGLPSDNDYEARESILVLKRKATLFQAWAQVTSPIHEWHRVALWSMLIFVYLGYMQEAVSGCFSEHCIHCRYRKQPIYHVKDFFM